MIDATRTTTILLRGLHDPANEAVWEEFDARYRPILRGFARRLGLSDADAADVAQETLLRFVGEYRAGRYDRSRSRLRSWLLGIARARIAQVGRDRARRRVVRGESAIGGLDDDAGLTELWETERRRFVLRAALEEMRRTSRANDRTIAAFEMLTLQQMPVAAVAEALSVSTHDVYLAKSRMASRLREIVDRLDRAYEGET